MPLPFFIFMITVKLTRYYAIKEFSPEKTIKFLNLIRGINVESIDDLENGIKQVRKAVKLAVGRRFRCTNTELINAFITIIEHLPLEEYLQITLIANSLEKARQR